MRDDREGRSSSIDSSLDSKLGEELEAELEKRLRRSLSNAAPQSLPTVGVRETIVDGVRARVRRRQRVAGGLAACCLVIAGATAGVASLHSTEHPGTTSAAAHLPSAQKGAPAVAPRTNTRTSGGSTFQAARAECAQIVEGLHVISGCYGVYNGSPDLSINGDSVGPGVPATGTSTPGSSAGGTLSNGASSGPSTSPPASSSSPTGVASPPGDSASGGGGSTGSGTTGSGTTGSGTTGSGTIGSGTTTGKPVPVEGIYRVVVPVGRGVTVVLPGIAGEIWSVPAVVPGQGAGAAQVRLLAQVASGVGKGSSATFESSVPATVLIGASALDACGLRQVPCGASPGTWSIVLVFEKS